MQFPHQKFEFFYFRHRFLHLYPLIRYFNSNLEVTCLRCIKEKEGEGDEEKEGKREKEKEKIGLTIAKQQPLLMISSCAEEYTFYIKKLLTMS